jgi:hypothetical protein
LEGSTAVIDLTPSMTDSGTASNGMANSSSSSTVILPATRIAATTLLACQNLPQKALCICLGYP